MPPATSQATKNVEIQLTQYIYKFVDVPIVIQRQVPQVQTVPETAAVPTAHFVDRMLNVPVILQITQLPVVIQRQVPRTQTSLKTVKVLSVPSISRFANVPVIIQITTWPEAMFNKATKHVETPQIYFCDQGFRVPLAIQ